MKSMYIHIPFCRNICSYCDFCKIFYNENTVNKYLKKLKEEIINNYKKDELETIYIGGGTPSSLNIYQLKELFSIIKDFNLSKNLEFTMEFNIEDVTEEKLKLIKSYGINRISVGIETINDKYFKLLNRKNNEIDIMNKIRLCKRYFSNISVDLMYGFNGETIDDLDKDLNLIKKLDVDHVSIYSLILEKNTKLYIDEYHPIDEELENKMYYHIIDVLENMGYDHYEISNFSRDGKASKHNLNYWNNEEYYGFGLGASGYVDSSRYTNTRSITKYLKGDTILYREYIDTKTKMEEELICGLRKMEGISKSKFKLKFNKNVEDVFDINSLLEQKLLMEDDDYIYIPKDKLYVSNNILLNFIIV